MTSRQKEQDAMDPRSLRAERPFISSDRSHRAPDTRPAAAGVKGTEESIQCIFPLAHGWAVAGGDGKPGGRIFSSMSEAYEQALTSARAGQPELFI